ncbi:MAG: hypothetical protein A2087_01135 [Spirochaetes bacterium GWD1_61_31]|nr:MAG: hypothetical protein A2Y37_06660 [Spirochaetes bacterium GWB1_60_80]OHD30451.1 MAG: hypothetical protein A2004_07920 [Spirochaetes bacterium GWC1_61_12]OHD41299.1 MAG: hypothetical protein A2087_01135 [Spirochaetes bacterium GWD1_61_31]OHD44403.1 MAG: hypothetical protein A2Y35_09815 [Spirochaetes bacterium GWE1_60_18]OHD60863.1 MAG: hypothetical protein A2Y32_11680 [Spirochaetes bacterium GWF1_60_12]HAP43825.1 hypothetical protein [Spirochaetaceae bacterium]
MTKDNAAKSATVQVADLALAVNVVLANSQLSAAAVARARRSGRLQWAAPTGDRLWLEAGGVLVAEGHLEQRPGGSAFVVDRMMEASGEAL